jgi:peptidoglycan/LPS O-acetylase OafA/YrhL
VIALAVPELMFGDPYIGGLLTTLHYMRFECMAVGALGAWLLIHQHFLLRWIYRLEIPALIALVIMILINFSGGFLINMISACIFIIFILNVATNPRRKLNLENPILSKLGTVTYGVYMYHPLVTFGVTQIIIHLLASGVATDLFLYASVAVSTLVVASVSYRWFELPVTKLRPALENKSPVVAEVPN